MPKGKYKGQKLIREVIINTAANTPSVIANKPEITLEKYMIAMKAAIISRMVLSFDPIFFFMSIYLIIGYQLLNVLPGTTINYVLKPIFFQYAFRLFASTTASAKDNDLSLSF